MDATTALALLKKPKGKKQKNKSRKLGRNFRWIEGPDGNSVTHSMTKYRADGRRASNKARKAAARARKMGHQK